MHLLIAKNRKHAVTSALIDYKWRRVGQLEFIDADGARVRVIDRPEQLLGQREIKVYFGYGVKTRRDYDEIEHICRGLDMEISHHYDNCAEGN